MKYKDVQKLFMQKSVQIKVALRIRQCKPYIRKAINEWLETAIEPNLEVIIAPKHAKGKSIRLSAQSLIHDYDMRPLDALFFIDWANRTDKDIHDALTALVHRSSFHSINISDEMWKRIDPEVLKEYEKIEEAENEKSLSQEEQYTAISNCNISEYE